MDCLNYARYQAIGFQPVGFATNIHLSRLICWDGMKFPETPKMPSWAILGLSLGEPVIHYSCVPN